MRAYLKESGTHEILIDVEGENAAERILFSHLQDKHVSILCAGSYGQGGPRKGIGMRIFIRNKGECEFSRELESQIEKRLKRRARRRE